MFGDINALRFVFGLLLVLYVQARAVVLAYREEAAGVLDGALARNMRLGLPRYAKSWLRGQRWPVFTILLCCLGIRRS